jgi:plasmid stabilization system protein ParE
MAFAVIYKPLAQAEVAEAYEWYEQDHIRVGAKFLDQLKRTNGFLTQNPHLYPCVDGEIRRANLTRFPYSLFFVVDGETVNVLSCFQQSRDPKTRPQDEASS